MGRRNQEHICAYCGKRINGTATECVGCLRLFHSSCLQRVKLKNKRTSYMLCLDCIAKKPIERVFVGPPKHPDELARLKPREERAATSLPKALGAR